MPVAFVEGITKKWHARPLVVRMIGEGKGKGFPHIIMWL
jgi:hypothetical protein